jgi:hypothetical protein
VSDAVIRYFVAFAVGWSLMQVAIVVSVVWTNGDSINPWHHEPPELYSPANILSPAEWNALFAAKRDYVRPAP